MVAAMVVRMVALSLVLGLAACFAYVWPFSVDDSYILAQYARRIASGHGYTFRAGPPTDGVTGPLWLVPLVSAAHLGLDPAIASKLLGGLCALGSALLVVRRLSQRALSARSLAIACPLIVSSVPFVSWAVAGLETAAAGLLALLLADAVLARPRPHMAVVLGAGVSVAWLRPELLPFAGVLVTSLVLRDRRRGLLGGAALLVGLLSVLAFRALLFGDAWPMVTHAKPPVLGHGATYVFVAGARAAGLALLFAFGWGLRHAGRREQVLVGALVAHAGAVLLAGGDWMPGMRLFAPVVPVAALALAPMLARRSLRQGLPVLVACGVLFVMRGHEMVGELGEARRGGSELARTAQELARTLEGVDGTVVALDVGALAYLTTAQVVDLGGLTEPRIAFAQGGHLTKQVDAAWLESLRPRRIVLHSRERPKVDGEGHLRWFAGYPMPWVLRSYRVERVIEHARDYFYVVLAPRDAPFS
jgi:hypothetical protein